VTKGLLDILLHSLLFCTRAVGCLDPFPGGYSHIYYSLIIYLF